MNVLIAILAGLAGGSASSVIGFFVTVWICQALQVRDLEGAIGYAGMFVGLLVGIAGMILSIVFTLRLRRESAGAIVLHTPMALGGIVALAAAGIWIYYNAHDHPVVDGAPPVLDFEIHAPANASLPESSAVKVRLQAGDTRDDAWFDEKQTKELDGRRVLTGHLQLYLKTSHRMVIVQLPGQEDHLFNLRLPASPLGKKYQKWSNWRPADFVFTPASNVGQRVPAEKSYKIRYLVESVER